MVEHEAIARRRAAEVAEQAVRAREVAAALEEVAADVERALAPVLARMGPEVWAGRAARAAATATHDAREDLAVAARSLRDVARDLRLTAATLSWRADELLAGTADGALSGVPR